MKKSNPDNGNNPLENAHEEEGRRKIARLENKIETTKHNIEVSSELIAGVPTDTQREKLIEKNTQRKHAIGSMKKEIQDIEQTIKDRSREP